MHDFFLKKIQCNLPADDVDLLMEEDSDEDDDDFRITVNTTAVSSKASAFSSSGANPVPEEERSTHFIAIRVTDGKIVENARRVQNHVVGLEPALAECCMKLGLFHVTLDMVRLPNAEAVVEAEMVINKMEETLREMRERCDLRFRQGRPRSIQPPPDLIYPKQKPKFPIFTFL